MIRHTETTKTDEKVAQFQTPPKFQTQPAGSELTRALQPHLVQQHARHLRLIRRRFDMRWKELQLLRLTLLVDRPGTFSTAPVSICNAETRRRYP